MRITGKEFCCDLSIGSLIYGIIMSVISGLLLLAGIGVFIYMNFVMWSEEYYAESVLIFNHRLQTVMVFAIVEAVFLLGLIVLTLEFSFSVALAYGASKMKPGNLQAYFVYGVVKITLISLKCFALLLVLWYNNPVLVTVLLCYCCVNALPLMMVYKARQQMMQVNNDYTYKKFVNEIPIKA